MAEPHCLCTYLLLILLSVPFLQGQESTVKTTVSTPKPTISTTTISTTTISTTTSGTSASSLTTKTTTTATTTKTTAHTSSTLTSRVTSHTTEISTASHTENSTINSATTNSHASESTTSGTNNTGTTHPANTTIPNISFISTLHPGNYTGIVNVTIPEGITEHKGLSDNPGLVAVLCIFFAVLCIVVVVTAVKFCRKSGPGFEKLDEVPMNGINEEAPFARYPPK
ncbi:putative LOC729966 homolog [Mantella aurantiaca]